MRKIATLILIAISCNTLQFTSNSFAETNDTYLSEEIQEYCVEIGEEYGICPELLEAIIETESRGQADAENGSCKGLLQISINWHKDRMERLGVTNIFDEYSNILVGADLLAELRDTYHDLGYVLDYYHGDSNARYNYENGILSDYARKILERSAELEEIHGK